MPKTFHVTQLLDWQLTCSRKIVWNVVCWKGNKHIFNITRLLGGNMMLHPLCMSFPSFDLLSQPGPCFVCRNRDHIGFLMLWLTSCDHTFMDHLLKKSYHSASLSEIMHFTLHSWHFYTFGCHRDWTLYLWHIHVYQKAVSKLWPAVMDFVGVEFIKPICNLWIPVLLCSYYMRCHSHRDNIYIYDHKLDLQIQLVCSQLVQSSRITDSCRCANLFNFSSSIPSGFWQGWSKCYYCLPYA